MTVESKWMLTLFGRPSLSNSTGSVAHLPKKGYVVALRLIDAAPSFRVEREILASLLWPGAVAKQRRSNLRTLLKRVREAQTAAGVHPIVIGQKQLRFDADVADCDALAALRAVRTGGPVEVAELAPAMTRVLVEGCDGGLAAGQDWVRNLRAQFVTAFVGAAKRILSSRALVEEPERETRLAASLVTLAPIEEEGYRALMRLHAARGAVKDAEATYDQLVKVLRSGPGSEPSLETKGLRDSLTAARAAPDASAPPADETTAQADSPEIIGRIFALRAAPPLLLAPTRPTFDARVDADEFRTLIDDVVVHLWKARAVRVVVSDYPFLANERDERARTYRMHLSVRRMGEPRLTVRVTHEHSGENIWAEAFPLVSPTYDVTLFNIAASVVAELEEHQIELAANDSPDGYSSFVLIAKARRDLLMADLPAVRRARRLFKSALQNDGKLVRAYGGIARSYWLEWILRAGQDPELLNLGEDLARKALELQPDHSIGHHELGMVALYKRRRDPALDRLQRAAELAPEDLELRMYHADALISTGAHRDGLRMLEGSGGNSGPPSDYASWIYATGLYLAGNYREAISQISRMRFEDSCYRLRAACHGMLGETAEAKFVARKAKEVNPSFDTSAWLGMCPMTEQADRDHLYEGLRRAGFK